MPNDGKSPKKLEALQPPNKKDTKKSLEKKRKEMYRMEEAREISAEITAKKIRGIDTKAIRDDFNKYLVHPPQELSNHDIRRITKGIRKVARDIGDKCLEYIYDSDIQGDDKFKVENIDDEYNELRKSKYKDFEDNERKYNAEEIKELLEHVNTYQQEIAKLVEFTLQTNPEQEFSRELSDFIHLTESTSKSSEEILLSTATMSNDKLHIVDNQASNEKEGVQNMDHVKFTFDQFVNIWRNTINHAIAHLEKGLIRVNKNRQIREESSKILKDIRDDRSEDNFIKYNKVVEYAKRDESILTALEKLKYENNVEHVKFTFDQFKNIGNKKLNLSINHLDTLISKNKLKEQEQETNSTREESSKILKDIRGARSEDNFIKYNKVVEYAKRDKPILTALEKLA
jgi:hypothetical protein